MRRSVSSTVPPLAAAAVVTAFLVLVTRHIPPARGDARLDALGYALFVAAGASVALGRWVPRLTLGLVTVVLVLYAVRHYPGGPVFATGWAALFTLRRRTDRRTALVGAAVLCNVLVVTSLAVDRGVSPVALVFVGWSAAAVLLADVLESRRSYLRDLEERARFLERTQEEEARRRVAEERLRIARDLHDSVAHAMATISVQAGAAAHVVDRRPQAAKEALAAISRASGEVLDELGAMLTLLRDDDEGAERAPTPGLEAVPDLVASSRAAGVRVAASVAGPLGDVPAAVGTAAYRIVQESLTNVLRHAPGAAASVVVRASPGGALDVEVADDGTGAAPGPGGTGMGVRGMRERAEATGGTFACGPRPGGGYAVRATWGTR
ncbi:MAG TPA: histidine kinase [Frankiaceae bacterium]|nr:histidine kinase [Frankiaceae bacterium]